MEGGGGRFIVGGLVLSGTGDAGAVLAELSTENIGDTARIFGKLASSMLEFPPNVSAETRLADLDRAPGGGGALRKS